MKTTKLYLLIQLVGCIFLIIIAGCTKEDPATRVTTIQPPPPPPSVINTPPQITAGANIQLVLPVDSCILTGTLVAGSKIKSYLWEKTSGPVAYKIEHPDSLITKVHALQAGTYIFQLTVTDSSGLTGKASVAISVATFSAFEYDLDLDIHTTYKFLDNTEICPWDCYYRDVTEIPASAQLADFSILQIYMYEETDSAAQAYNVYYGFTSFRLSNELYASGTSSFNLKKVIQQGGGSFSGMIQLNSSSALRTWREDAFKALHPLTVTGTIDTTAHTVNIQIKGKIIF